MAPDPVVTHNAEASRYELALDGALVGRADYREQDGALAMTHTEVSPRVGGRGLGGQLVRYALDDARERGLGVLPFCSFVAEVIRRHPGEYAELVPAERRVQFGLT